jgi:hypothetical protein
MGIDALRRFFSMLGQTREKYIFVAFQCIAKQLGRYSGQRLATLFRRKPKVSSQFAIENYGQSRI